MKNILRSFLYYGYITYLCDADTAAFALAVILPYNILIHIYYESEFKRIS
ncbi:hypothetical protein M094_2859 [Bacteroides uniformis str. 3978 T3 ii]|uniref:Uncharacterized protein n=1 Tax=Bacteroides uniformis str. 3978 T3 ii TaxID=1339349 RepID=A0A078RUE5_BACUN|nr:hypothetical protein M094_2859 [Bacteroides uniformis str. 3978 T3 ii]